ncbi:envelope stress response membrane protein PspC [Oceanidesulfovibrio indonesiensis]|uniref:Envelope stress response membrane protein PspC n=1 Tax=Oceanidesulfovibrio indonesiensis TaxID=54767 RepID=A0A7M3MDE7_9BACT|nr:PspC domain-containing protein [Oceanidesulfovibrio indonesiensis]TVM16620.1 envelope stress response membrane protein PspC [Oceanidesulfovibrio indonesiensis]
MKYGRLSRGPYRARDGAILGVFKGLAQHFDFSVFWLRLLGVIFLIGTGFWPAVIIYLLAALIMKPTPRVFGDSCDGDPGQPSRASTLKSRFERLEQRIRRMEDVVTSREFQWDSRFGRRQSR